MKICRTCGLDKPLDDFYSNGSYRGKPKFKPNCKDCHYAHQRKRLIQIIESHFGQLTCQACGYSKCFDALDCHHRDPTEKAVPVKAMGNYSEQRIVAELTKCDLLCANCHREVHSGVV